MRKLYLQELESLKENIILYAIAIENILEKTEAVFFGEKIEEAYIKKYENMVYDMCKKIEKQSIHILSTQQPVARDLRFISSNIKISNYIRRIGEHVLDAIQLMLLVEPFLFEKYAVNTKFLALKNAVVTMLKDAMALFIKFDSSFSHKLIETNAEAAYAVIKYDDVIDTMHDSHVEYIIKLLKETTGYEKQMIHLIQISKYFERMGDDVEQIVKNILFVIHGENDETADLYR